MTMMSDASTMTTETTVKTKILIKVLHTTTRSPQSVNLFTDHRVNAMPMGPHAFNASRETTGQCAVDLKFHSWVDKAQMTVNTIIQSNTTKFSKTMEGETATTTEDLCLTVKPTPSCSSQKTCQGLICDTKNYINPSKNPSIICRHFKHKHYNSISSEESQQWTYSKLFNFFTWEDT